MYAIDNQVRLLFGLSQRVLKFFTSFLVQITYIFFEEFISTEILGALEKVEDSTKNDEKNAFLHVFRLWGAHGNARPHIFFFTDLHSASNEHVCMCFAEVGSAPRRGRARNFWKISAPRPARGLLWYDALLSFMADAWCRGHKYFFSEWRMRKSCLGQCFRSFLHPPITPFISQVLSKR